MRPLLSISPNYATIFWQLTPKTIQVYLQAFEDSRLRQLQDMDTQAHKIGTYLATRPLIVADVTNCKDKKESTDLQRNISKSYPQKPYWVENIELAERAKQLAEQAKINPLLKPADDTPMTAERIAELDKLFFNNRG